MNDETTSPPPPPLRQIRLDVPALSGISDDLEFVQALRRPRVRAFARHGHGLPASQTAWLWALGPCTEPATTLPADRDSHADLRPTIEYLLGLRPRACADCGSPIPEVSSCTQGTYARRAHADSDPMVLGPDATVQLSSVR